MKRRLSVLLALPMLFGLVAHDSSAAQKSTPPPSKSKIAQKAGHMPTHMSMVTGNSGGTVYYIGAGMTTVLNDKIKGITFTSEATNVGDNFWYVTESADVMGTVALDGLIAALKGDASRGFETPLDNLSLLLVGNMNIVYMLASKASGVTTPADFVGKRCGWPSNGTSASYAMNAVAEAYGIDINSLNKNSISISEQVDAIKDGHLDVFSGAGSIPMAGIMELTVNADVNFISLKEKEKNAAILARNASYTISTVPAGTYKGQDEDAYFVSMPMVLICNNALDEETAYRITKTLCESKEEISKVHAEGKAWSADSTKPFFEDGKVPFHPGAARYYKEIWK